MRRRLTGAVAAHPDRAPPPPAGPPTLGGGRQAHGRGNYPGRGVGVRRLVSPHLGTCNLRPLRRVRQLYLRPDEGSQPLSSGTGLRRVWPSCDMHRARDAALGTRQPSGLVGVPGAAAPRLGLQYAKAFLACSKDVLCGGFTCCFVSSLYDAMTVFPRPASSYFLFAFFHRSACGAGDSAHSPRAPGGGG